MNIEEIASELGYVPSSFRAGAEWMKKSLDIDRIEAVGYIRGIKATKEEAYEQGRTDGIREGNSLLEQTKADGEVLARNRERIGYDSAVQKASEYLRERIKCSDKAREKTIETFLEYMRQ